jgi:hypothetical protein
MSYFLDTDEAEARLQSRYGIEDAGLTAGDLDIAASNLDSRAPFVGEKTHPDQLHQFPRKGIVSGEDDHVPEEVLDWVALRAYQLATDDKPAVSSERADEVSVTYRFPKRSQTEKRMARLLTPYLRRHGRSS